MIVLSDHPGECSPVKSQLLLRMLKRQSLLLTTILLKTALTLTIRLNYHINSKDPRGKMLLFIICDQYVKKKDYIQTILKKKLDIHLFFSFLLSCSCFFGLFLQIISKITTTSIKRIDLVQEYFNKYNQQPKTIITGITITIRILVIMISIIINIIIIIAIIIKRLLHLIIAAQQNDQF